MEYTIKASVREIVEFVLKSGNIDFRGSGSSLTLMQDGIKIHKKIQLLRKKQAILRDAVFTSEVKLSYSFEHDGFHYVVDGRADGIWIDLSGEVTIEEIKSTVTPLDMLTCDDNHWHWAQAKCYGFMYCKENQTKSVKIRLTYVSFETEDVLDFYIEYTAEQLEEFFKDIMEKYHVWMKMDYDRKTKRDASIKASSFPYDKYRKGQREFAVMTYRTIEKKKKLYIEAPTGTGKTISAIFPSVKGIAEGVCKKIFYLTAKTITRQAAEQAHRLMGQAGYYLSTVTLTAKDKICMSPFPEKGCNPADCPYANGHFDRVNNAVMDILISEESIKRDDITAYADKHKVCPHEFQLDITDWADMVICDYNYAFDQSVSLKRFFSDMAKPRDFVFLVDEAHNLVDRAREMFSSEVSKNHFYEARKHIKSKNKQIYKLLGNINSYFLDIKRNFPEGKTATTTLNEPRELYTLLTQFMEKTEIWFGSPEPRDTESEGETLLLEAYFNANAFLRTAENYDERFAVYMEISGDVTIKLLCLDPSYLLSLALKKAKASVFFSATLTPGQYFRQVLGGNEDDFIIRLPSPYERDKLCLMIDNKTSTRYKDRESSYEQIADRLYEMIQSKKGNYFAFFSSYAYLQRVLDIFIDKYPLEQTLVQSRDLDEEGRELFLRQFDEKNKTSLLAFAVMGGIFSEGIDLAGEKLIGAAIVGVGLPLISEERDVVANYYDKTFSKGFDYAYMYPGMNKVLQAAGRVIRSENDKGVVLLIDDRFITARYLALFPYEWQRYTKIGGKSMRAVLTEFWDNNY